MFFLLITIVTIYTIKLVVIIFLVLPSTRESQDVSLLLLPPPPATHFLPLNTKDIRICKRQFIVYEGK